MAREILWSKIILEEFIRLASLTKDEEMIIRTRVDGWTRVKQANELNMSLSTIDRLIKRIKQKYDGVQPYSPLLPPRRPSAEEDFMDTCKTAEKISDEEAADNVIELNR